MQSKNYANTEKNLTKLELETTIVFAISILLSLSLVYNNYLRFEKNGIYSKEEASTLVIFNRILVVVLTISYLYINISNEKIAKSKGKKADLFDLQIGASALSLISALIVLYVVIKNNDYNIVSIEYPSI